MMDKADGVLFIFAAGCLFGSSVDAFRISHWPDVLLTMSTVLLIYALGLKGIGIDFELL